VIARNTAFSFKGKNVDARNIGRELGVRYVLEGSVQRDQNRDTAGTELPSKRDNCAAYAAGLGAPLSRRPTCSAYDRFLALFARSRGRS
jgi:hypothetical protein